MSNVALIPARAGSKRLPGKNMKLLGGKPLIQWTIEAALKSGCYDAIWVCTDDPAVADLCTGLGVWWRDPVPDTQPDLEWVNAVMSTGPAWQTFSILRPTSPFRSASVIRDAWARWHEISGHVDSLRAVRKVSEHPGKAWEVEYDGMLPFSWSIDSPLWERGQETWNQPTQSLPALYVQTAGLEIAHTRVLPNSISGTRVAPFILEGPAAHDINDMTDWWVAERYLEEMGR